MPDCSSPPSGQLLTAIGQFNRGDWFHCHETLEDLWRCEHGEMRDFYQGVLQIAVALHHWRNGNFGGAVRLLDGGVGYLQRVSPACQRVDVSDLVDSSRAMRHALTELGPERMAQLLPTLIPRLQLVPA